MTPPAYFETIRREAAGRWVKLEDDPELAAPWHQIFRQVQSLRHVLSELLQNADDAEATEAWIGIEDDGTFFFEHNGEDFTDEQFRSLCRFGYSNKRNLFTIGFRGIGFKSTFSLGTPVSILTPTLSVAFHTQRFTEPIWVGSDIGSNGRTRITVNIVDEYRRMEIERNFDDWLQSPLSLLFFRHIRCIHLSDKELRWQNQGDGPVANSKWVEFAGNESEPFLHVRSVAEPFPSAALEEIRKERMASDDGGHEFPPCSVEIALGVEGRLYVVLPTGGDTGLPFCGNAPFILTPDREHIKSPAISDTNRWLLDRMGRLAANTMLDWLANEELPIEERAVAYALMPPTATPGISPDHQHGELARDAFSLHHDAKDLPGGDFETHFSFAQALTESAKLAKHCLLVVSLPASDTTASPHTQSDDLEVGGERGRAALDRLRNAIGRVEASWRPASVDEGFEIVRRRLFEPLLSKEQFVDRDNVARAFFDLYRTQKSEFPTDCASGDYEKRLRAAYPIHPELFNRLYSDWSTLVKFQRTRGVLRLMAAVIHSLWEKGDKSAMILPCHVPIDDPRVQFELTRYLSDNWVPVIEKDVDGPNSLPLQMDGEVPNLGKFSAHRRVARTMLRRNAHHRPRRNASAAGTRQRTALAR